MNISVFASLNILDTIVDTTLVLYFTIVIEDGRAQNHKLQASM